MTRCLVVPHGIDKAITTGFRYPNYASHSVRRGSRRWSQLDNMTTQQSGEVRNTSVTNLLVQVTVNGSKYLSALARTPSDVKAIKFSNTAL